MSWIRLFRYRAGAYTLLLLAGALAVAGGAATPAPAWAADAPTASDSILVFVAHPDDEALTAAGVLETALAVGAPTKVAVVTNGDHKGTSSGLARQSESIGALAILGLSEDNVIFMGYPGITAGGALRSIYNNYRDPAGAAYVSPATGRSTTYGTRGLGLRDFHSYWTGSAGAYRGDQILADIEEVLRRYRPTKVYTHSPVDEHSDHRLAYRYLVDALAAVQAADPTIRPDVYSALIHDPTAYPYADLWAANDLSSGLPANFWKNTLWPEPPETGLPTNYADQILRFTPTVAFTAPPDLPQKVFPWAARVSIPVPIDMQTTDLAANLKFRMIDAYVSQRVSFNYAFGKSDEVFWKHPWSRNIALAATVTASSANTSGFQLPRNVVDGVVDGAPAGAQAEWVAGSGGGVGESLTLNWPRAYRITSVRLFDRPMLGAQVTSADLSFGDGTVLSVGALPDDALTPLEVVLPVAVEAASLTISITGFADAVGRVGAGLAEVEVYGDPVGPTGARPPLFVSGPMADGGRYFTSPDGELLLTAVARDPDGGGLTYSWQAQHGAFVGSGGHVTYHAPSGGGLQDLVTVRVSDGVDPPTEGTLAIDVLEGVPNGLPVLQDAGPDGLVSVEAEFYDATAAGGDPSWIAGIHAWTSDLTAGFSGLGALIASPNSGNQVTLPPFETRSPRLDYQVRFLAAGTYHVWIRGLGATTADDTVHAGLDGIVQTGSNYIQGFSGAWGWSKTTGDGPVATLVVSTAGVHTVNLFMREDGFRVDKLLLSSNAAYVPTGLGPAANPRRLPLPVTATPTITPPGGDFIGSVEVTLASATPGAAIHYTLDGSTPTLASAVYSAPFTLSASATVKALAEAPGYEPSGLASADFAITLPTAATPTITPPGGDFTGSVEVTLASATPDAVFHYTLDGSTPTLASAVYSAPFTLSTSATVKALAEAPGHEASGVASADFTITLPAAATPTVDSLTPAAIANQPVDQAQTFTATYSDANGAADLGQVYLLVNTSATGTNGVYLYYDENLDRIYLRDAANTTWGTGGILGTVGGTLSNEKVVLDLAQSSGQEAGDTLTLAVSLSFKSTFLGLKNVYLRAVDDGGLVTAFVQKGTVYVGGPPTAPTVDTLTPAAIAGLPVGQAQTFTATYSDANGATNLKQVYLLINTSATGLYAVYLYYDENLNRIYLRSVRNTTWGGGGILGTAGGTLKNENVVLDLAHSSAQKAGNTLTLAVTLTFKSPFRGQKNVYLRAIDDGGLATAWVKKGTVTVTAAR